ncbi:MAG: hypothetical protein H7246_09115 [Phycisphaerae bacterium]|nr:hypothetical protein [Saprospiraceae bacterium]
MKNKIFFFSSIFAACVLVIAACTKREDPDSVVHQASVPYTAFNYLDDVYIYVVGNTSVYSDIPDVVAVIVDSVYGFAGGYGGKTGMDSLKILKSDVQGLGSDTSEVGGTGYFFQKYSKGNYRITINSTVLILDPASANSNPGPTNLEGNYLRAATGYIMKVKEISPGFYLLGNPGGAASVASKPYFLYNSKSVTGTDSLSFAIQEDLCGGGIQLVSPLAPDGLTSAAYTALWPPIIASYAPLTLQWRIKEFAAADPAEVHPGAALCNWGLGIRTFVKQ